MYPVARIGSALIRHAVRKREIHSSPLLCKMGGNMKVASFSLAEARMASDGNFTQQALETVETASFKLRTDTDNVAGVLLPIFKIDNAGNNFFELMGLGRGGTEIRKSVKHYERALDILVRI